jgi:hypothetical protein
MASGHQDQGFWEERYLRVDKGLIVSGQFFKRIFSPTRQACAYATVAFSLVGAYARVGAYSSFKKLASEP